MIRQNNTERQSFIAICSILAIILTNLSQLPFFVELGITQYLSYPAWIVLGMLAVVKLIMQKRICITKELNFVFALFIMLGFIFGVASIFGTSYLESSMFLYTAISLVIAFTANILSDNFNLKTIELFVIGFVISTAIVEANIYVSVFSNINAFESKLYAYEAKNSISLLIATAVILALFLWKKHSKIIKLIFIGLSCFMLLLLKSRAVIVGGAIVVLAIIFTKTKNKKTRRYILLICLLFVIALLVVPEFRDLIINKVLFNNRSSSDLNELSAGRWKIYQSFPDLLGEKWLVGIGPTYFESAPLSAILQFGILGGVGFIIIMFFPLFNMFLKRKNGDLNFVIFLLSILYCFNALFEGLAPFGPGAKCFMLWFMLGIVWNKKEMVVLEKDNEFTQEEHTIPKCI